MNEARFNDTFLLKARSEVVVTQMRKDGKYADKMAVVLSFVVVSSNNAALQSLAFYGLVFLLKKTPSFKTS